MKGYLQVSGNTKILPFKRQLKNDSDATDDGTFGSAATDAMDDTDSSDEDDDNDDIDDMESYLEFEGNALALAKRLLSVPIFFDLYHT